MLTVRIIPCLDCRDGRVVKGIKFQGLRDAGNPAELAQSYELQGADEIVLLDVSATPQGRANQTDTVKEVRNRLSIPLTVGGGVRKVEDAARLLGAGADKVGINTAAVDNPDLINEIAERFGCQCTVIAIDAAWTGENCEVDTLSGKNRTGIDAIEWAKETTRRGAGEILLTSWDRDGTRSGYDLKLLNAVSEAVNVPVIASGGADSPQHMVDALKSGAHAVLAASFSRRRLHVSSVKDELAKHGIEIRK